MHCYDSLYVWLIPISHYRRPYSTTNEEQIYTGINLFTPTSLSTKQNVYYQRLYTLFIFYQKNYFIEYRRLKKFIFNVLCLSHASYLAYCRDREITPGKKQGDRRHHDIAPGSAPW